MKEGIWSAKRLPWKAMLEEHVLLCLYTKAQGGMGGWHNLSASDCHCSLNCYFLQRLALMSISSSLEDSISSCCLEAVSSQLLTVSFFKTVSAAEPSHPWSCPFPWTSTSNTRSVQEYKVLTIAAKLKIPVNDHFSSKDPSMLTDAVITFAFQLQQLLPNPTSFPPFSRCPWTLFNK